MNSHNLPSNTIISYTAGMIDGEGYIGMNLKERLFRVSMSQADHNRGQYLTEWLYRQWQIGEVYSATRATNLSPSSTVWVWQISARRDVLFLLEAIYPHLIVKREKANELIKIIPSFIDDKQRWTRWTQFEETFVNDNHLKMTVQEIANHLNRTHISVQNKIKSLGIQRPGGKGWRKNLHGTPWASPSSVKSVKPQRKP